MQVLYSIGNLMLLLWNISQQLCGMLLAVQNCWQASESTVRINLQQIPLSMLQRVAT
jgi:hypothetical protein